MTYNVAIPNPGDLLSQSQKDLKNNFSSANTSFGKDHYPFNDGSPNNGKHKQIQLPVSAIDFPSILGQGTAYSKVSGVGSDAQLFWRFANGAAPPLQITNNFISPTTNPAYIPLMAGMMLAYGSVGASSATSVPVAFAAAAPFSLLGVATAPYFVIAIPIRAATNPGDSMSTGIVTSSITSTGFNIANIGGHSMAGWYWAAIGPKS